MLEHLKSTLKLPPWCKCKEHKSLDGHSHFGFYFGTHQVLSRDKSCYPFVWHTGTSNCSRRNFLACSTYSVPVCHWLVIVIVSYISLFIKPGVGFPKAYFLSSLATYLFGIQQLIVPQNHFTYIFSS